MKKIIIDTNAWMALAEFKLDILSALADCCDFKYQLIVLSGTITELNHILEEQRGRFKSAARLALQIIKTKNITILPRVGEVDEVLVKCSQSGDLVLTQDLGLKRRLTKPYLTIRQKNRIVQIR
ncbi:MAG TPA: hypothetical protein VJC39_05595 [Candidatus Nanoarchaeia archaeon]|nr:hypothetical protein [Candidatus Nanoarchaeia archaeon]